MSTATSPRRPAMTVPAPRTALRWVVVAALLLAVVAGAAGWALSAARARARTSGFDAVVVVLNGPGTKGCVRADGGGKPICTEFYTLRDAPAPQLHERVHAQLIMVPTATGSKDGLIISPASD